MNIHPTAIIEKNAKVADDCFVGPYAFIGNDAIIEKGTMIGQFCVISGKTKIGKNCRIFAGAVIGTAPQDLKYKGEDTKLEIGDNNTIREYTTINKGTQKNGITKIGNNNLLMAYTHVAHNCVIGNDCIIANCGTLGGYVVLEDKVIIGGLTGIHQFTRIGTLSIVGGCSKVVQDIVPFSTADGHPAKIFGLNTIGLKRAGIQQKERSNLHKAFKILFNSGLSIPHAIEKIKQELENTPQISKLIEFIKNSERGIAR